VQFLNTVINQELELSSKCVLAIPESFLPFNPHLSPNQVGDLVLKLTNSKSCGQKFKSELIDGEALLLLTLNDLTRHLKLKLGLAIKIHRFLQLVKVY